MDQKPGMNPVPLLVWFVLGVAFWLGLIGLYIYVIEPAT